MAIDKQVDRRQLLKGIGAFAVAVPAMGALASCAPEEEDAAGAPLLDDPEALTCTLVPEQMEGPYYIPLDALRSNIVEDREGLPLALQLTFVNTSQACAPLVGAAVEIWHCDAHGWYSSVIGEDPSTGHVGGKDRSSTRTTFLRGVQITDANGQVNFQTIYPGWYYGRALHIHMKVYVGGGTTGSTYRSGTVKHNGQVFFKESINAQVMALAPYSDNDWPRKHNSSDGVYSNQGGASSVATLTGSPTSGYVGTARYGVKAG